MMNDGKNGKKIDYRLPAIGSKIKMVLIFLSFLSTDVLVLPSGASSVFEVLPGESIQNAIDLATSEDTVIVYPGIYTENIIIKKNINLYGIKMGGSSPTIDARRNASAITCLGHNLLIKGFVIINATDGNELSAIELLSNNNIILNNIIINNDFGIISKNSNNNTIYANLIKENDYGLFLDRSYDNIIYNNVITNNTKMNVFDNGTNNWHKDNLGNYYGPLEHSIPGGNNIDLYPLCSEPLNNSSLLGSLSSKISKENENYVYKFFEPISYALLCVIPMALLISIIFFIHKRGIDADLIALFKIMVMNKPLTNSEFYRASRSKVYESSSEKIIDIDFVEIVNEE